MNLPSFIKKPLCFWKGLWDKVASCGRRRLDPQARDAESGGAKVNYPTSGQRCLWPDEDSSRCLGHQFAGSGWRVETLWEGEVSTEINIKLGAGRKKEV